MLIEDSQRRQALALAIFTVAYNIAEGAVAMLGTALSGSLALWGFGLDSFVESLSGMVIVWRFWKPFQGQDSDSFASLEARASCYVGISLLLLAAYVAVESTIALVNRRIPDPSFIGVALALASLVVMPVLFSMKFRLGREIDSPSLIADSKETLACMLLSAALLIGIGAFYVFGLWWLDSAAALIISLLIAREGVAAFLESRE